MVSRRRGRLRACIPTNAARSCASRPPSASAGTTTSPWSAGSTSPTSAATRPSPLAGRRACSSPPMPTGCARSAPRRHGRGRSSTTAVRAIRSGTTCSPTRSRSPACGRPRLRSCSSGTATSRSRSGSPASELDGGLAPGGTELPLAGRRSLLNPGSVGQPRDGDARAAWLLLDLDAGACSFRRVDYDVDGAQADARAAGLPETLAARLRVGV